MKNKLLSVQFIIFIFFLIKTSYSLSTKSISPIQKIQIPQDNLKKNFIKTKRFTLNGELCAATFIHNGEKYFDCAKSLTPDGLNKNIEWCYVESPQEGFRNWNYCMPTMDYDYVREYIHMLKREMSGVLAKISEKIGINLTPGKDVLSQVKKLKKSQIDLIKKLHGLLENLEKIKIKLKNLKRKKEMLDTQDESIKDLKFKISKLLEDRKNNQNTMSNLSADESESINKTKNFNCKGMFLYEDEDEGDGLLAKYYKNEYWSGEFEERLDAEIEFIWGGSNPLPGINSKNFSAEWRGYLKVPKSGYYTFVMEADDGYELVIRDEVILRSKFDLDVDNQDNTLKNIGEYITSDEISSQSIPILIEADSKIKIQVKYYHSMHNDLIEKHEAFVQLYWSTDEFEKDIIPKKYLFSKDNVPAFKIFIDNNNSNFVIRKLFENDMAFKKNEKYFLQDIPKQFIGATTLKFEYLYNEKEINFHTNLPCIVNIGVDSELPNPLDEKFEKTGKEISILKVEKHNNIPSLKFILAIKSAGLSIYRKKFEAGDVHIPLKYNDKIEEGFSIILFFTFDKNMMNKLECLGDEVNISKSTEEFFRTCSASSELEGMDCKSGFSGEYKDEEGGIWASSNEGVGAWIEIELNGIFEIRKFMFKNRKNRLERNKVLELFFSDNRKILINIKNTDDILEFPLIPIKSNRVKITIKEVYDEINNGGAFGFYGKRCDLR